MADQWFGFGGDDTTGLGTLASPWLTYEKAATESLSGDICWMVDGEIEADATVNYMRINSNRIVKAVNYRAAVQLADAGYTTMCGRWESTAAANNPYLVDGITFDAKNTVNWGFAQQQDAAEDIITQLHNVHVKDAVVYGFVCYTLRGRQELVNTKASGRPSVGGFVFSDSSSGDGNQVIDMQGCEIDITGTGTGIQGVKAQKVNNLTNTMEVYIKGLSGTISGTGGSEEIDGAIRVVGVASPTITNSNIILNAVNAASNHFGISVSGLSIAITSSPTITNNTLKFNSPSGYGIALGESVTDANVTGGLMAGNKVTGKYYASNTPHNFLIGQGVTGEVRGNTSIDGYIGYLISKTTNADVIGNTAFDCYGSSYYIKGATDCTVRDNTAVCSGKFTQRDIGVLSVVVQGAVNTASATIQENLIIVADISKIHSLAQIGDINQVCTFVRNTYIIPDTVDVATEQLFSYQSATPNNTLAQWNAQTEITNDIIVPMPAAAIAALIEDYRPVTGGGSSGLIIGI